METLEFVQDQRVFKTSRTAIQEQDSRRVNLGLFRSSNNTATENVWIAENQLSIAAANRVPKLVGRIAWIRPRRNGSTSQRGQDKYRIVDVVERMNQNGIAFLYTRMS